MPFQPGNTEFAKRGKKTFAERYRLTPEEQSEALGELLASSLQAKTSDPTYSAVIDAPDHKPTFGKPGKFMTGFVSLDRLTLGFDPGELVVLGAGPNQGKTQLATYTALHNASRDIPVLYASRELNKSEMKLRLQHIARNTKQSLEGIDVADSDRLNPDELISLINTWSLTHAGGLIIIDHLHLFARGEKLTEILGRLSDALRVLAKDCNVGIMALSQFNREKYAPDIGPTNDSLKESGYIADDAYAVTLLWKAKPGQLMVKHTKSRRVAISSGGATVALHATSNGYITDDWPIEVQIAAKAAQS